jgi:membrane-associated phospholipid phosphatase
VMVCAVILVHQHHIIDVVTGIAVAMIARAVFLLQPNHTSRRARTGVTSTGAACRRRDAGLR